VVAVGVTVSVPPAAAILLVLPSEPITVTLVALVAATVSVEDCPAVIDVGLADIVTVGAAVPPTVTVAVAVAGVVPAAPVAVTV